MKGTFFDKDYLQKVLNRINGELQTYYSDNNEWSLNYKIGYILFQAYYKRYSNVTDYRDIYSHIENCIEDFSSSKARDTSLFNGVTGLGWTIQHVYNLGLLTYQETESLNEIDGFLVKNLELTFDDRLKFDLLYGLLGKGLYFLSREQTYVATKALRLILEQIGGCIKSGALEDGEQVDLGLAHGISGLLVLLSKLCKSNIDLAFSKDLLVYVTRYLLKTKLTEGYISCFPSNSAEPRSSRLAWCYGDLSIAIALTHANTILNDSLISIQVTEIVQKAINRNIANTGVFWNDHGIDCGLCHGTLGIAYILFKLNGRLKEPDLTKTIKYWLEVTKTRINIEERFLGFKTAYPSGDVLSWGYDGGLVDGLGGIGLMLMGLSSAKCTGWDSLFLLDID